VKGHQTMISDGEAGSGLLSVLAARFLHESKTRLRRLIANGVIRVNGNAVGTVTRVRAGDVVSLPEDLNTDPPGPAVLELEVLHDGADHLVINKPPGIATLPTRDGGGHELCDTLAVALNRDAPAGGPYVRPHFVHRLDRETSGCLLVAKGEQAGRALSMQFQERVIRKTYLGVLEGVLPRARVEVAAPIRRASEDALKMVADQKGGRPAVSIVELREAFGHFCFVEVRPHTGRQHQIRVHMASIGFPLAVDFLYGRRDCLTGADLNRIVRARRMHPEAVLIGRCPLHAAGVAYRCPSSGELVDVSAPLPTDILGLLDTLRAMDPRA